MKFSFLIFIFFAGASFLGINQDEHLNLKPDTASKYTIVIHGGAGNISKDLPENEKQEYINSLTEALNIGKEILQNGGSSLDAVEKVVRYLEDDPHFNAGKGAVFNSAGVHELDASIMNGKDLSSGAVTLIRTVKNPISLARLVMENTPYVLLGGEGAEEFAKQMNVEIVPNSYFDTPERVEQFKKLKEKSGTVGCVALDSYGNLAAATSTGGLSNKMPGRIGDSPLINDGTYADNNTCAISGTGIGELFIKNTVAFNISALMKYKNYSLQEAADEMINKRLKPGDGGIIAVDKEGNYVMTFNTIGMFRGAANSEGVFEVKIWE
ncbi:MAG TPA: isoaspartyl peptidase/L-asparaginase [Ignavibacteriaceae bacterium]|nr:isoaspartyl peptidase/L-asparaginase [Ignavibacteriaceae bacterium]